MHIQAIQQNSYATYYQDLDKLQGREAAILHFLRSAKTPLTDRQIADQMGYSHRSEVQPRISELIKKRQVEIAYNDRCPATEKTVRFVRAAMVEDNGQGRLF